MLLACLQAGAQDWLTKDRKAWSDGPLVPEDFDKRASDDSIHVGWLDWSYFTDTQEQKTGNLKYKTCKVTLYMDQLASWYDPARYSGDFRYFQTDFDIAEAARRKMQNEINRNPGATSSIVQYYYRIASNRVRALMQESREGRDMDVVDRYAAEVARELAEVVEDPFPVPAVGKRGFGIGMYAGYGGEYFFGPMGEGVTMGNNFVFGWVFPVRSWDICLDLCIGGGTRLKKDGFYHDDKYDYDWVKGRRTSTGRMNVMGGYRILDTDRLCITPLAGFGVGFVDQKMGREIQNGSTTSTSSETAGFRLLAGVQCSYKLSRSLDSFTDSYSESRVNFRLYGASTDFRQVGRSYSINFGIVLDWTGWVTRL